MMQLSLIPVFIWQLLVPFQLLDQSPKNKPKNLQDCIAIAMEQNSALQVEQLSLKRAAIEHRQAHLNRLPGVGAYVSHGFSKGRSVDPTTNLFTESSFGYGNQQISADMTLFNGLQTLHAIRAKANASEAVQFGYEAALIQLKLEVIEAYLGVQTADEMVVQHQQQLTLMEEQMRRSEQLYELGVLAPQDYFDLKGQWQRDQQQVEQIKKQAHVARLRLARILEIPVEELVVLEKVSEPLGLAMEQSHTIGEESIRALPQTRMMELRQKEARNYYKMAKGTYFPSLSIGANIGGQYSNKVAAPYFEQFQNNLGRGVSASIRLPLFNRLQTFHQVKLASYQVDQASLLYKQQIVLLRESTSAHALELAVTRKGIASLQLQIESFEESFRIAQAHFEEGNTHSYIYLSAKNKLDQARRELVILNNTLILQSYIQDSYLGQLNL
jgi:outer membrane protein